MNSRMFRPVLGGLVLGFFGFCVLRGRVATRNGSRYEGAIVEDGPFRQASCDD